MRDAVLFHDILRVEDKGLVDAFAELRAELVERLRQQQPVCEFPMKTTSVPGKTANASSMACYANGRDVSMFS